MLVFSKEKMLQRLKKEGRIVEVDDESKEIMNKIDGLEAHKNHFKALVFNELEYYVIHPELGQLPVNYNDTEEKTNNDQASTSN